MCANNANESGAIIPLDGKSVWGKTGGFGLTSYSVEINDGEGGKKQVSVDEG